MKRFRLPIKLALAIVPIGLVALAAGAWVSWTSLEEARIEERVSYAAEVAADAMDALVAVSAERDATLAAALEDSSPNLEAAQTRSDRAIERLRDSVGELVPRASGPASGIAGAIFSNSSLSQARLGNLRDEDPLSEEAQELFDEIGTRLITVASQSTLYFGDPGPAREGEGAVSLARASFASFQQEQLLTRQLAENSSLTQEEFEQQFAALESTVVDWLANADDNSPTVRFEGLARSQVTPDGAVPDPETFLYDRNEVLAGTASQILERVAGAADRAAATVRAEAATVAAVVLGVLFVTVVLALVLGRSTVRRVRSVTAAAQHVAEVELPKLVDALSNPKGQLEGSVPEELEEGGSDEVGELAGAFRSLHGTLVEVANRQMDILRRGVSEIFVTLARRNGSLVDRQLALIDDLESRQEDPEILDGYYKLDHLATRMRRNAESLLVLAGSDSPRMWSEPLEMDEVVRAALGEVDEYRRIDVLALEPARLKGRVVTDLAHLMSELLDNATQFSPPSERVRVTGLFDDAGYVLTIADSGLGISEDRMAEINHLIVDPPVLGLALEPTLGMYVVARLAARHGITVRLVPGVPGTTVRITLPRHLLESVGEGTSDETPGLISLGEAPSNGSRETKSTSVVEALARTSSPSEGKASEPDGPAAPPVSKPETPAAPPVSKPETPPAPPAPKQETPAPEPVAEQAEPASPRHAAEAKAESPSTTAPPPRPAAPHRGQEPTERASQERPAAAPPPPRERLPQSATPPAEGGLPRRPTGRPPERQQPAQPETPHRPAPGQRPADKRVPEARPAPPPTRPVDNQPVSPSSAPSGRLPTRRPGSSFQGDVSEEGTSSVSQRGAEGIRSALDGYRLGRDIASNPPRLGESSERRDEGDEE